MLLWNRAVVVGVPGVGKTSLCEAVSRQLGYHYINYGELMLEIAIERDLTHNLEDMLQLKPPLQYQIWKSAAFSIQKEENVLIDLHGVDLMSDGYLISLPFEIIPPEIIVIIETSYDEILGRRTTDISKNRALEDYKTTKEHMTLLKYSMATINVILGSNLVVLENDDFQTCLEHLKTVLRR
jgi:adenylate kinase